MRMNYKEKTTDVVTLTIPIKITKANGDIININRLAVFDKNRISTNATLESNDYQIGYDPSGKTPDPSTYTITATPFGFASPQTQIEETITTRKITVTSTPNYADGTKIFNVTTDGENNHAIIQSSSTDGGTQSYIICDLVGTFAAGNQVNIDGGTASTINSDGLDSTYASQETSTIVKTRATPAHTVNRDSPDTKFTRRKYTLSVFEGGGDEVLSQDSLTVFGTQAGTDGVTVLLTNPAVQLQTDESATVVTFDGTETFLEVYAGNTPLNYVEDTGGIPPTLEVGEFKVSATSTTFNVGSITLDNVAANTPTPSYNRASVAKVTGTKANQGNKRLAKITFTVTSKRPDGREIVTKCR